MKNLKKFITLGLAATAAVSVMSMTALADYNDRTSFASLPTLSELDTSKASRENPVKYIDEKTGATVTIYDPNITVNFKPFDWDDLDDLESEENLVSDGSIYVKYASNKYFGGAIDSFQAPHDGKVNFTLPVFAYSKFNVSLNNEGITGSPLAVVQNQPVNTSTVFTGLEEGCSYEFRVSSYLGDSNSSYIVSK